jgi:hypothetical protein
MDFILFIVIIAILIYHRFKVSEFKRWLIEANKRERLALEKMSKTKSERTAFMDASGICNQKLFNRILEVEMLLGKFQRKPLLYLYIKLHRELDKLAIAEVVSTQWKGSFMFFEDFALRVAIPSRSHEAETRFAFNKIREDLQTLLFHKNIACSVGVGSTLGTAYDSHSSEGFNPEEQDTIFFDGDRTTA